MNRQNMEHSKEHSFIKLVKEVHDKYINFIEAANVNKIDKNQEETEIIEKEKINWNITELQGHKILYFLYGFYYYAYGKNLFTPNFKAWKYGPVESKYREQQNSENDSNEEDFLIEFKDNERNFLSNIIVNLININVWDLVEVSHTTDPWKDNFESYFDNEIKETELKKYFSKKNRKVIIQILERLKLDLWL